MGKSGKEKSGKEARKAAKAEQNRAREKGRRQRKLLDQKEVQSFGRILLLEGYELKEVGRDGNCFFRSIADQLNGREHGYDDYRQKVMDYVESHEDDFAPFMSFGESEEEEDKDFEAYVARLRTDGEWAGQVELIAAAQALSVHIVVHQLEHPSYRIESQQAAAAAAAGDIHLSYHDGEHYNSVRPLGGRAASRGRGGSADGGGGGTASGRRKGEAEAGGDAADDETISAMATAALDLTDGAGADEASANAQATGTVPPRPAAADGGASSGEEGGGEPTPALSAKASKQKEKAKKKEEKAKRKEQKHREAVAAAGGAGDGGEDAGDGEEAQQPGGRSVITL